MERAFQAGDRIRVVDGTFLGMEGTVLSPEEAVARNPQMVISSEVRQGKVCWVLLTIFGRPVPVDLQNWQISGVESG